MNILTTLSLIFNGITFVCLSASYYYRRKIKTQIKSVEARKDYFDDELRKYRHRYLRVRTIGTCGNPESTLSIEEDIGCYCLYSYISDEDNEFYKILIKEFPYTDDENSKTYAYRCAEELKDKMEEEI